MTELGELEAHHADFSRRNARIVAVSLEGAEEAKQTQAQFPHLLIVADSNRSLANAVDLIHPHSGPDGGDTAAPTTILVDNQGLVRWVYRPERYISRLSAKELMADMDKYLTAIP